MVTLVTEVFFDFSPHERAVREPRIGEHESRLVSAASQKKEKSRKMSGTRVMCGSHQHESDISLRSQGFFEETLSNEWVRRDFVMS